MQRTNLQLALGIRDIILYVNQAYKSTPARSWFEFLNYRKILPLKEIKMSEIHNKNIEQPPDVNTSSKPPSPPQIQTSQEDFDTKRIKDWEERVKKITPSFNLKQNITEDETGKKVVTLTREETTNKPLTQEIQASTFCAAYGSANYDYAVKLLTQTVSGFFRGSEEDVKTHVANTTNAITGALLSLAPKDEIEGMLCTRLLVLHDQAMKFMCNVAYSQQITAGVDLNVNRATKLMRIYNETLEALMRYRRKGEQKVTVQHVTVGEGGQAIVNGQINQGGGDHAKR